MYDNCCQDSNIIDFGIVHNPRPIELNKEQEKIIKELLWYNPNIDSVQSTKIDLIDNFLYDDFIFKYIIDSINMDYEKDVLLLQESINTEMFNFYQNNLCINCQKIVMTCYKNQTKTKNLLRCIRNAIAHGDFKVINNLLIGFNRTETKTGKVDYRAILKLNLSSLVKTLGQLKSPKFKVELYAHAFKLCGYDVILNDNKMIYDLKLLKDGKEYLVDFKDTNNRRHIHLDTYFQDINKLISSLSDNQIYVLLIDSSKLYKEDEKRIKEINSLRVVDVKQVPKLFENIDILNSF